MKKAVAVIYTALFTAACCVPSAAVLISPSSNTVGKEEAASAPEIIKDSSVNKNIGSEFDDYFTKSIPVRPQIITAQNMVASGLLGKESNNVITGSGGWLFTSESADEYSGIVKSERSVHNIAETVRIMQKSVTARGANFVFTAAPDKNEVYPEYMPSGYIKGEENTLSKLEKYLEKYNVNYVDLKQELLKRKNAGDQVYLKTDTHWNGLGALYGYNAIMNAAGSPHESYSGVSFTVKNDWEGDIAKMLYPAAPPLCSQYYFDIDMSKVRFLQPRAGGSNEELLTELMGDSEKRDTSIRTMNPKGRGSLYFSRDSFGRAMLPFVIGNYRSANITRSRSFDLKKTAGNYTDVIYEMVERKLDSVTDNVPLLYAPEVKMDKADALYSGAAKEIKTLNDNGDLRVYGLLDPDKVKTESVIYVRITENGKSSYYEAFPVTEMNLLDMEEKSDYGFSALIPGMGNKEGKPQISVEIS